MPVVLVLFSNTLDFLLDFRITNYSPSVVLEFILSRFRFAAVI
jgi:hypothetical protein